MIPVFRSSEGFFSCFGRRTLNWVGIFSMCCFLRYGNDFKIQVWNYLPGFLPSVSVSLCLITTLGKVSRELLSAPHQSYPAHEADWGNVVAVACLPAPSSHFVASLDMERKRGMKWESKLWKRLFSPPLHLSTVCFLLHSLPSIWVQGVERGGCQTLRGVILICCFGH